MLLTDTNRMDIGTAVLDPSDQSPCQHLTPNFVKGDFRDEETVYQFGKDCDVVTIEIEQVNTAALKRLKAEGVAVHPDPEVIEIIQDKRKQKAFYRDHNIPTAPFQVYENASELQAMIDKYPIVQKAATMGYDGKGVTIIRSEEDIDKVGEGPGMLEEFVSNAKEIAVIVVRNPSGEKATFPAVEMEFHPEANLVEYISCPAMVSPEVHKEAERIALATAEAFQVTGVLAIEMFVKEDGTVWVNESAPRPHNSGHMSIEANHSSQYEQHIRAILDLPLGDTGLRYPAVMINLLGEDGYTGAPVYSGIEKVMAKSAVYVHVYGKRETRPFRKMGHVTIVGKTPDEAKEKAIFVRENLKVIA